MAVDINDLRGLATLLCMAGFLAVVLWAYSSRRNKDFEEASMLPFAEGDSRAKETEKSE
jgi:cytochrome c oxidase cbb3-type subunit 4